MRKVLFTEAQLKHILGEDYPLSKPEDGMSGNAYGTEVGTGDMGIENPKKKAMPTDKYAKNKTMGTRWFINPRHSGFASIVEEGDVDDETVAGFGKKYDNEVSTMAKDGGKMIKNMNKEKKHRLNTGQVRISRMEKDKEENPERYEKNGGDEALKILKATTRKQQSKAAAVRNADASIKSITDGPLTSPVDTMRGTGHGHHEENETSGSGNIYYY